MSKCSVASFRDVISCHNHISIKVLLILQFKGDKHLRTHYIKIVIYYVPDINVEDAITFLTTRRCLIRTYTRLFHDTH